MALPKREGSFAQILCPGEAFKPSERCNLKLWASTNGQWEVIVPSSFEGYDANTSLAQLDGRHRVR